MIIDNIRRIKRMFTAIFLINILTLSSSEEISDLFVKVDDLYFGSHKSSCDYFNVNTVNKFESSECDWAGTMTHNNPGGVLSPLGKLLKTKRDGIINGLFNIESCGFVNTGSATLTSDYDLNMNPLDISNCFQKIDEVLNGLSWIKLSQRYDVNFYPLSPLTNDAEKADHFNLRPFFGEYVDGPDSIANKARNVRSTFSTQSRKFKTINEMYMGMRDMLITLAQKKEVMSWRNHDLYLYKAYSLYKSRVTDAELTRIKVNDAIRSSDESYWLEGSVKHVVGSLQMGLQITDHVDLIESALENYMNYLHSKKTKYSYRSYSALMQLGLTKKTNLAKISWCDSIVCKSNLNFQSTESEYVDTQMNILMNSRPKTTLTLSLIKDGSIGSKDVFVNTKQGNLRSWTRFDADIWSNTNVCNCPTNVTPQNHLETIKELKNSFLEILSLQKKTTFRSLRKMDFVNKVMNSLEETKV